MYVNGNYISTGLLLSDNLWHFICVAWMSENGYYEVYLDGSLTNIGQNLSRDGFIEANGNLMIGQEQVSIFSHIQLWMKTIYYHLTLTGRCWNRSECGRIIRRSNGQPGCLGPFSSTDGYRGNVYIMRSLPGKPLCLVPIQVPCYWFH